MSPLPTCTFQLTNVMSSMAIVSAGPVEISSRNVGTPTAAHHTSSRPRSRASSGPSHCTVVDRHEPVAMGLTVGGVHRTQPVKDTATTKNKKRRGIGRWPPQRPYAYNYVFSPLL